MEMNLKEKTVTFPKEKRNLLRNCYVWVIAMAGLLSFLFVVIFWFTNIFQNIILSNLILQNGTKSFENWMKPSINLTCKLYIYNYTNVEDYEIGKADKLRVEQLGPYVYKINKVRVNVQMHDNGTVSYKEKISYQLESGNVENDVIVVPNLILLMLLSALRNSHYTSQLFFTIIISTMKVETFIKLTVNEFLWGYDDKIFALLVNMGFVDFPKERFGFIAEYEGILKNRFTVNTGSMDIDNLGIIQNINGNDMLNIWGDKKCDKIYGTDGTMFPPKWIQNHSTPLIVYVPFLCKDILFNFHGYDQVHGVPSLRYKLGSDTVQMSYKESCFCPKINSRERKCPPVGTFNISACTLNLPFLMSLPNFYGAEKSLIESIDGLKPDKELHESIYDLHQFLAVPMNATVRFQFNVEVRKAIGIPYTGKLPDGQILPILWSESTVDRLPQNLINIYHGVHVLTTVMEVAFRWGSIILFLSSIYALYVAQKNYRIQRDNDKTWINVSGQNNVIE